MGSRAIKKHIARKSLISERSDKTLVSVIICFLNAERFIQEAIESVLAQTYRNWELLLIDDGSTDRSSFIALNYAQLYPRKVTYRDHANHKNLGLSASRNVGIHNANGRYIAFLDSDDVWTPQKLKEQVEIMISHPEIAMVFSPALNWYSWTKKPEDAKRDNVQKITVEVNTLVYPPDLLKNSLKDWNSTPGTSGLMVKRDIVNRFGGFENDFHNILEDQVFYVKLFLEEPVFASGQMWWKYRQHPHSICNSIDSQAYRLAKKRFWKWVKRYFDKHGVIDKEILSIVQKRMQKFQ